MASTTSPTAGNISERQGRLRTVIGGLLVLGGAAAGVTLALDDASVGARLLSLLVVLTGASWLFGGPAQICQVDALRGVEHPTEPISLGMGGRPVADPELVTIHRRRANEITMKALALTAVIGLPVLLL